MKKHIQIVIAGLALLVTVSSGQAQIEYIQNGGFETGDFTGWTASKIVFVDQNNVGDWVINNGSFDPPDPPPPYDPPAPPGPLPPISGSFDALFFSHDAPGQQSVSQCFVVPQNVQSAVLGWTDLIRNFAWDFIESYQEWRVWILAQDQEPLLVFSTKSGDPLIQETPTVRSFDLTSALQGLEGRTLCVSFEYTALAWYLNVNLDNVSFVITSEQDQLPHVIIAGCDTGVVDVVVTEDGRSISHLIKEFTALAKNHGGFVSSVAKLTNALKKAGIITTAQKDAIQSCAGQARIP